MSGLGNLRPRRAPTPTLGCSAESSGLMALGILPRNVDACGRASARRTWPHQLTCAVLAWQLAGLEGWRWLPEREKI